MDAINLWDRQPHELEQCWVAFQRYRDLPLPRPLMRDFAVTLGYPGSRVQSWAQQWSWDARLLAWESHLDSKRQAVTVSATEEMAKRHVGIAKKGLEIVDLCFDRIKKELKEYEPGRLKAMELKAILDVCSKLERISNGEATERVEGGLDYSSLTNEDLVKLEQINKKVKS